MPIPFRKKKEQTISPKDIDPDAISVLRRLNKAGYIAYLVGGGVRDLLIGRRPKDFDIATNASPRQIKSLFRNSFLIGRRFRLALIRFGNKQIETATFRRSPETGDDNGGDVESPGALYQEADNLFGTPEEDAQRRDFTVNALFYDIESRQIIDYTDGLRDIEKKVLRSIGDPNIRFREDPVRMLRAVRLSARIDFNIHSDSAKAITRHASEIMQASKPRLFEETIRLFTYNKSEEAFRRLWKSGLMREVLPAIDTYIDRSGGKKSDAWRYLAALDAAEISSEDVPRGSPYTIRENALQLAVLLAPLFFEHCKIEDEPNRNEVADTAEQLVNDILITPYSTESWRIPRFLCQDTVNILESAAYFKSQTVKKPRFFRQPWFYTAMHFWRICSVARNDKTAPTVIDSWADAFESSIATRQTQRRRPPHTTKKTSSKEAGEAALQSPVTPRKRKRRRRPPAGNNAAKTNDNSLEKNKQKST